MEQKLQRMACLLACAATIVLAPIANAQITEIIDSSGDGAGNTLDCGNSTACDVAVDGLGNDYVAAFNSDNVFRITPGGTISSPLAILVLRNSLACSTTSTSANPGFLSNST